MVIIGAARHAKEVLDVLLESNRCTDLVFFDDVNLNNNLYLNRYEILHSVEDLKSTLKNNNECFLGVGSPSARKVLYDRTIEAGGAFTGVKSKSSAIGFHSNSIDIQVDIFKNVFISSGVTIGKCTLLNTGSQVHHDVEIGEYCEVSPGVLLLGNSKIGDMCSIGAGAIVNPSIEICNDVVLGSGSVVISDITSPGTYVGNPVRKIK